MNAVIEDYVLTEGRSLIDVRNGPVAGALLIDGIPVALHWPDEQGSIAEYLLRAGAVNFEERLDSLRAVVERDLQKHLPISAQIKAFLELFVPSSYRLSYYERCGEDWTFVEFDSTWRFETYHSGFYPFDFTFLLTQPTDSLDKKRIEHYVEMIQSGKRPKLLTASSSWSSVFYVLDGHHKLAAYIQLRQPPSFIDVARLDAPQLDFDPFEKFFNVPKPLASHYRDQMNRPTDY